MSSATAHASPLAPRAPPPGHSPPRGIPPPSTLNTVPRGPPPRTQGRGPLPVPQARGPLPGPQARGLPSGSPPRGPQIGRPPPRGTLPGQQTRGPPPGPPPRGPSSGSPVRGPPSGSPVRGPPSGAPVRDSPPVDPPARTPPPRLKEGSSLSELPARNGNISSGTTPTKGLSSEGSVPTGSPVIDQSPGFLDRGSNFLSAKGPPAGPLARGTPSRGPPPRGPPPRGPPPRGPPPSQTSSSSSNNEALQRRPATESGVVHSEESLLNNSSNRSSLREPPPRGPPPRGPPPRGALPRGAPPRGPMRLETLNGTMDQGIPPVGSTPSAPPRSLLENSPRNWNGKVLKAEMVASNDLTKNDEETNGNNTTPFREGPIESRQTRPGRPTRIDPPRGPPPRGPTPNIGEFVAKETLPSGSPASVLSRVVSPPRTPPPPNVPRGIPGRTMGSMAQLPQGALSAVDPSGAIGILTVKIVNGVQLKAGNSLFGKADPYCNVTVGQQTWKTSVHSAGGKAPIWNEETEFKISTEKQLFLEVMNKESVGSDKLMGRATANISDWISAGGFRGEVALQDANGIGVGSIQMAIKFDTLGGGGNSKPTVATGAPPLQAATGGWTSGMDGGNGGTVSMGEFTDQEIYSAFVAFDLDKNNFVGAAEIRHVLVNIGEQTTDEEVDEMIRMVDTDGDGQVSFDDFYRMVTGGKKPIPALGGRGANMPNGKYDGVGGNAATPQGQNMIQQRHIKKQALEEFAQINSIKPESITKAAINSRRETIINKLSSAYLSSYKKFQAEARDTGFVEYSKFCEIIQVDPSPQCESVFRLFDNHQIGQVDMQEFLISLSNFAGGTKDDKLRFAFMVFDEDGNGVITQQELTKILKANHMAQTDAEVARKADTIMSQADKDGDGVITFDEFVVVSRRYPNILLPGGGR